MMQVGVSALMGGTFNWLTGKVTGQPKLPNNSSHPNTANTNKAGTVRVANVEPEEAFISADHDIGPDNWDLTYTPNSADPQTYTFSIDDEVSAAKTSTSLFGKEVANTATRMGRDGRAVEVLFKDGSKLDINAARVKEWIPNPHPNAPAGTLQKVKFDNFLPGSKGYRRTPTQGEIDFLNSLFK